ncbi:unnamed protein product [Prorocentrum cordatum]|uniref:EF-hand domain-containing protein n=1 Tax=Prorocentrum cordatum TaxID=2364126 RepID=A0ABN9PQS3_9DINO|nr:unnamed protein product [Polarella glacialis]
MPEGGGGQQSIQQDMFVGCVPDYAESPAQHDASLPGLVMEQTPPPPQQPQSSMAALLRDFEGELDELLTKQHHEVRRRLQTFVAKAEGQADRADERASRISSESAVRQQGKLGWRLIEPPGVPSSPGRIRASDRVQDEEPQVDDLKHHLDFHRGRMQTSVASGQSVFDEALAQQCHQLKTIRASIWLEKTAKRGGTWRAKLLRFTSHWGYETANALIVLANAIIIAWETQYSAKHMSAKDEAAHFDTYMFIFCALFTADALVRIIAQGCRFFYSAEWKWNWFDAFVVLGTYVEIAANSSDQYASAAQVTPMLRVLKLVRMMRILRAVRSLVHFRDLRIMVSMLCEALVPLTTFAFIMAMVFMVFGVFFAAGATEYMASHGADDGELIEYYGDVFVTMLTLFKSISGGIDWQEAAKPLEKLPVMYSTVFYVYVSWSVFALMNVVNRIFIDNTIQRSKHDRDYVVQTEIQEKKDFFFKMGKLFAELDPDHSGTIRLEELHDRIHDPRVKAYFRAIDLNPGKVERLFQLLDSNGSGDIDQSEFKRGCERLRGDASALDLAILRFEVKQMAQNTMLIRDLVMKSNEQSDGVKPFTLSRRQ